MDNRSPAFQILFFSLPLVVVCVIVAAFGGKEAVFGSCLVSVVAIGVFSYFALRRRREIRHLSAEIDEVLQDGRSLHLTDYCEGDLAALHNQLQKMCDRLGRLTAQLTQEKGALADALADVSHQIRTPLCAVELMLPSIERAADEVERKRLLRELEILLERISWLVATLLKIAKVDAGALTVERHPVKISAVVERACAPLAIALDIRDINLSVDVPEDVGFNGDILWSAEALENVIKNCLEYTPSGGSITIVATQDALASHIVVQDCGPGIAPEDLPHLFERFYRGRSANAARMTNEDNVMGELDNPTENPSDSPMISGFGIGLALAQSLISAQGGTLRASNALDENGAVMGARFEIAFPKFCV